MRTKEKSTNIYFLRHGQTDYPSNRIYCDDKEDPGLNSSGIYQAKCAAIALKNVGISKIYASPAKRTQMTAREFSDISELPIHTLPAWVERKFGIWEGLYFNEIEENYPEEYLKWKQNPVGYTPEAGETIEDVGYRLSQSLAELTKAHQGENILLVTHTGPIRVSLCASLAIPIENYRQIRVDYASISRVDYGETRNNIIRINHYTYPS